MAAIFIIVAKLSYHYQYPISENFESLFMNMMIDNADPVFSFSMRLISYLVTLKASSKNALFILKSQCKILHPKVIC